MKSLLDVMLLILPLCGGQLIVNMKNKGNEILRESIQVKTIVNIDLFPQKEEATLVVVVVVVPVQA